MSNVQPLISVIIPVYNGERYLAAAIESVLVQRYRPLQIIVADDGSTDGSAAVAQSFAPAVQVVTQPNLGAGAARNHGVALAQGEFLAFLDADDLWVAGKLVRQQAMLQTDAAIALVFGQVEQFYSPELVGAGVTPPPLLERKQLAGYHVGAMLIRSTVFEDVGPFDPRWQVAHFIEWYTRAQALGLQSLVLPEVVMKRRIHTTNLGIQSYARARQEYIRLAKAKLDRRFARENENAGQGFSRNESN